MARAYGALLTIGLSVMGLSSGVAAAQTGVSDDRVSLPDGPGSLDGIGDNASVASNLGLMSYHVELEVPAGFPGVTPELALRYSSGNGSGSVGMGWTLPSSSIERMTSRGLPEYSDEDAFVADGGEPLVRVSDDEPALYRARYEGAFTRYSWHQRGAGDEGYWTAEYANGSVGYFGADASGGLVESARVRSADGVFRYLLVEVIDVFGHALRYQYRRYGSAPLLDGIGYVHDDEGNPRYTILFDYEERQDHVSDARGGFNELLAHRLSGVEVFADAERVRRYALRYEDYATSGGASRLTRVESFGTAGGRRPLLYSFGYSRALGGTCDGSTCAAPSLVSMGSLGVNLAAGSTTLIDMNGDALPDVVDTSASNPAHRVFLSVLDSDAGHRFATPFSSAIGTSAAHALASARTQELDYDGDGFTDLVNTLTGQALRNLGGGDWAELVSLAGGADGLADADFELDDDGELAHLRFFDFDGDRRIDVMYSEGTETAVYRNLGAGGFAEVSGIEPIGYGFAAGLELADMNGDGLLDPVLVSDGEVRYRLNLGRGRWAAETVLDNAPVTQAELPFAQLEDINGDGLDDLVVVVGGEVRYALNRNGARFDDEETLSEASGSALPSRDASVTVLFADMNANGSSDIVWIDSAGEVTYLELFPVRPNLLTRIDTGLGLINEIRYTTSAEQRAGAAPDQAWPYPVPMPMIVVEQVDTYAQAPAGAPVVHELVRYRYAGGFYDGAEKQFRGYSQVDIEAVGDEHQESGHTRNLYDVGATDPYRHGRLLSSSLAGDDGPIFVREHHYQDCPLEGVPDQGLAFEVRFTCLAETIETVQEGAPEDEWATVRTTYQYDGYGNVTLEAALGVTALGGGACAPCERSAEVFGAPCGAQCLGDERYQETEHVPPSATAGRWLLGMPAIERVYGRPGSEVFSERRSYYDGEPFVGLPLGELRRGLVSRVSERVAGERYLDAERSRYDDDGNVVESLRATAGVAGEAGHSQLRYDETGLRLTREEEAVTGKSGELHHLVRELTYHPLFDVIAASSDWYVEEDGAPAAGDWTRYAYDEHGRVSAIAQPGDTLAEPTTHIAYEMQAPLSAYLVQTRSEPGAPYDIEGTRCVDGFGRQVQTRTKIAEGRFAVEGAALYNRRGQQVASYLPYESSSGACAAQAEEGARAQRFSYDAAGRSTRAYEPDGDVYGTPSSRESRYGVLVQWNYDPEDLDPDSRHFDTPTAVFRDGLGRIVRIERLEAAGAPYDVQAFRYDELGNLRGWVDAAGNERTQRFDALGRVLAVEEADGSTTSYEYDDAGNVLRREDARGAVIRYAYDELDRRVAAWDEADPTGTRMEWIYDRHPSCASERCGGGAQSIVGTTFPLPGFGRGAERFGYDARGQNTFAARDFGAHSFEIWLRYDNAGRMVEQTFPNGRRVEYRYDAAGHITAIPGLIEEVDWGTNDLRRSVTYANGSVTRYEYDELLRLSGVDTVTRGGERVVDLGFARDRLDRVRATSDRRQDPASRSLAATFSYDAHGRLERVELDDETLRYGYDALENLVSKTSSLGEASPAHVGALRYEGERPRALTEGAVSFSYDAAGQVIARGGVELDIDGFGRVQQVRRGGESLVRYGYAAPDTRVMEATPSGTTLRVSPSFEIKDGISRVLIGLDQVAMVEVCSDELQSSLLSDLREDGVIDGADAVLAQLGGRADASPVRALLRASARRGLLEDGERVSFFHNDHLGSRLVVSDAEGERSESFAYYPFGLVREASAGQSELAAYAGLEPDPVTGFVAFAARDYDPEHGRFLSPDPAWQTLNEQAFERMTDATGVYSYAGNDPNNYVDEDGQFIHLVVGAAVGAVVNAGVEMVKLHYSQKGPNAQKLSAWQKAKQIGRSALIGAGLGALTGGVSAIGGLVSGAADIAVERSKYRYRAGKQSKPVSAKLRAVQVAAHVLGGVVTAAVPIGLATAGVNTTPGLVQSHVFAHGESAIGKSNFTIAKGAAGALYTNGRAAKKAVLHKSHNKARVKANPRARTRLDRKPLLAAKIKHFKK